MDNEHYFTAVPSSASDRRKVVATLRGKEYSFITDAGVFSRSRIDPGTRLLIEALPLPETGSMLDLGCGYGPVGIVAARTRPGLKVIMVDVNERAAELALLNASRNGAENVEVRRGEGFSVVREKDLDLIATNPPVRAGKQVVYGLMAEAREHLRSGGVLCVVMRTKQGARSLEKKLAELYTSVETIAKGGGYRVFAARYG